MIKKGPFTLLIHFALAVIVAGAFITHFFGIQGTLTLPDNGVATDRFDHTSGPGDGTFPFRVALRKAEVDFYPGTTTPRDFRSFLTVAGSRAAKAAEAQIEVSMNNVGEIDGWRFYQSGLSAATSTLSVSHDPWGIAVTYAGYILLLIGFIGYLLQRRTSWRALLNNRRLLSTGIFLCMCASSFAGSSDLPVMQRPLAANLGEVYVYWNDRICPMQTMARDVTAKLYGGESYRGFTAEQVLSGWLFYFDSWERDWISTHPAMDGNGKKNRQDVEREMLIHWLGTGEVFRIYPYKTADGHIEWLSLTGSRPSRMELEQWKFMQTTMPGIKMLLLEGKNVADGEKIEDLIRGQKLYAGADTLPSEAKMSVERLYNRGARPALAAALALVLGIACFMSRWRPVVYIGIWMLFLYILAIEAVLWWIGDHIPLSTGPETMMFMGFAGLAGALVCRSSMIRGALLAVAAMALFVAAMGGRTPRIGNLMPVLASPLLAIHVMLVMTSYVLFLFMAVISAYGLLIKAPAGKRSLWRINMLVLPPAVFLLGVGIFTGAVWANQSWGRYWGWDPKETCALITFFVYALPLHWASPRLKSFRRPKVLFIYLLVAVATVFFTYFGANYLLPGLHSYA